MPGSAAAPNDGRLTSDRARELVTRRWQRDNQGLDGCIDRLERRRDALTSEQRSRIAGIVDAAPPVTAEQREKLGLLLNPGGQRCRLTQSEAARTPPRTARIKTPTSPPKLSPRYRPAPSAAGSAPVPRPAGAPRRRFCSDLCRLRGQRSERVTETGEFGRAAIRMIRQMAKRVGASDIAEFGAVWEVITEAEHAVTRAIDELRESGYSWAQIGAEIGWGRQRLTQWRQRGEFPGQRSVARKSRIRGRGMSRGDGLARLSRALEEHGCMVRGTSAQCPGPDHANGDRRPACPSARAARPPSSNATWDA